MEEPENFTPDRARLTGMANISELLINAVILNEPKEVDQAQAKRQRRWTIQSGTGLHRQQNLPVNKQGLTP